MSSTRANGTPADELLRVEDLKVHFPVTRGVLLKHHVGMVKAVDGVSFTLKRGETRVALEYYLAHFDRAKLQAPVTTRVLRLGEIRYL